MERCADAHPLPTFEIEIDQISLERLDLREQIVLSPRLAGDFAPVRHGKTTIAKTPRRSKRKPAMLDQMDADVRACQAAFHELRRRGVMA